MVNFGRVQKELQECNKDINASGINVNPKFDIRINLTGTIPGPVGTPYEGGTFKIDIDLPDAYPFEPPRMKFATKVWDTDLVKRIGSATAAEVRATGIQYAFGPCIAISIIKYLNVCRDPRWGWCYESYGEDTKLVESMTDIILGLQGEILEGSRPGNCLFGDDGHKDDEGESTAVWCSASGHMEELFMGMELYINRAFIIRLLLLKFFILKMLIEPNNFNKSLKY
ncbi:hypothetical protein M8C21_004112 [Ambrosia artemisiifolia]|uniref:UBC core domain-containing protein n=1 Tax=Ambrosia artemisiifolia TaxID=4212 RepID=A0AAD5GA95_AMBAR|nr:hypothetical protein M8C21_004112 [Ambrosia artemisiifolia]